MITPSQRCRSLIFVAVVLGLTTAATAAAARSPSPAVSSDAAVLQYVEQLPTAQGSIPTSSPAARLALPAVVKPVHTTSKPGGSGRPAASAASAAKNDGKKAAAASTPDPLRAAMGGGGLGRGASLGIALGLVTLLSVLGLVVRRRGFAR